MKFTEPDRPKKSKKLEKTNKSANASNQKNFEESECPETPLAPRRPKNVSAPEVKSGLKDKNLSDVLGQRIAKRKDNMNAFAQTDMAKGIAQSAPEAPVRNVLKNVFSLKDMDIYIFYQSKVSEKSCKINHM